MGFEGRCYHWTHCFCVDVLVSGVLVEDIVEEEGVFLNVFRQVEFVSMGVVKSDLL